MPTFSTEADPVLGFWVLETDFSFLTALRNRNAPLSFSLQLHRTLLFSSIVLPKEDAGGFMLRQGSPAAGLMLLLEQHHTHIPSVEERTADSTIRNCRTSPGSFNQRGISQSNLKLRNTIIHPFTISSNIPFHSRTQMKARFAFHSFPSSAASIKPFAVQESGFGTPL